MTTEPPTIGDNIRNARTAKQLTQLALAHAVGWSGADAGAHICKLETNSVEPRVSTLRKIADALGVDIGELLNKPK